MSIDTAKVRLSELYLVWVYEDINNGFPFKFHKL